MPSVLATDRVSTPTMSAGSVSCQVDDFQKRLRDGGLWEETIQELEKEGCSNWSTFCNLDEKHIDELPIPKLQKPTLKKLLRKGKRKPTSTSSHSGFPRVRVLAEDLEDSRVCGILTDCDQPIPPIGDVTVEARRVTRSMVVGLETSRNVPTPHWPVPARHRHLAPPAAPTASSSSHWLRHSGGAGDSREQGGETAMAELQGAREGHHGGNSAAMTSSTARRRQSQGQEET